MYTYCAKSAYAAIYHSGEVVLFASCEGTAMPASDWEALCERLRGVARELNNAPTPTDTVTEACQEALALAT